MHSLSRTQNTSSSPRKRKSPETIATPFLPWAQMFWQTLCDRDPEIFVPFLFAEKSIVSEFVLPMRRDVSKLLFKPTRHLGLYFLTRSKWHLKDHTEIRKVRNFLKILVPSSLSSSSNWDTRPSSDWQTSASSLWSPADFSHVCVGRVNRNDKTKFGVSKSQPQNLRHLFAT